MFNCTETFLWIEVMVESLSLCVVASQTECRLSATSEAFILLGYCVDVQLRFMQVFVLYVPQYMITLFSSQCTSPLHSATVQHLLLIVICYNECAVLNTLYGTCTFTYDCSNCLNTALLA